MEPTRPRDNRPTGAPRPAVRLHIERLVLEGLPVPAHEAPRLRAAVAAELSRLLAGTAAAELAGTGATAALRGSELRFTPGLSPTALGARIARAVHAGLRPPAARESTKET